MVTIKELKEMDIPKYNLIFYFINDLFGDLEGIYFKTEVNGQTKILQRRNNLCILYTLEGKNISYEMFSLDDNYNIFQAGFDDYELTMYDDLLTVQERDSSIVQSLSLYKRSNGVDNDGYDGIIIYVQFDEKSNKRLTLTYQQMYNPLKNVYYYAKERMPFQIIIEHGLSVKNGNTYGPLKTDRYIKGECNYDNDFLNYNWVTIREYGLYDVLCELRYQQMYNEGSFNKVYHFHTKVIDAVYIDEKYKNSKNYHVGLLPRRAKYFKSLKFDYEQIGYKLMAINEFGLTRVLHEGAYNLYKERDVLRYIKTRFILPDGSFSDTWPLAKQIHREEIVDLIKQYGFNSEIPKDIIDIYNGENETVKLVKDLIDKVKEVKKELDKPENSRMCLTLSFIDD